MEPDACRPRLWIKPEQPRGFLSRLAEIPAKRRIGTPTDWRLGSAGRPPRGEQPGPQQACQCRHDDPGEQRDHDGGEHERSQRHRQVSHRRPERPEEKGDRGIDSKPCGERHLPLGRRCHSGRYRPGCGKAGRGSNRLRRHGLAGRRSVSGHCSIIAVSASSIRGLSSFAELSPFIAGDIGHHCHTS